ncbi:MAG: 50S ribosomal protein L23 [Candidatus Melainabacteria bacterium]|nr:50S ribosomal protein L23 [Candidatus Melainabacteria bacterium]
MSNLGSALSLFKRPLVTEKTTQLQQLNQYVFEVSPFSNKIELKKVFEEIFPGRKVLSVRTIRTPGYRKRAGKKMIQTSPKLKAIFSVDGDPIELFPGV